MHIKYLFITASSAHEKSVKRLSVGSWRALYKIMRAIKSASKKGEFETHIYFIGDEGRNYMLKRGERLFRFRLGSICEILETLGYTVETTSSYGNKVTTCDEGYLYLVIRW